MTQADETRRAVMLMAWAAKRAEPSRSFSACLKGAWRYEKRAAKASAKRLASLRRGGMLQLSPSLIRSPQFDRTRQSRYAGRADWNAARLTSRIGA